MVEDGRIFPHPLVCEGCAEAIEPGARVWCADGYDRRYGEFVLSQSDDLHETNWPVTHEACAGGVAFAIENAQRGELGVGDSLPKAMVVRGVRSPWRADAVAAAVACAVAAAVFFAPWTLWILPPICVVGVLWARAS